MPQATLPDWRETILAGSRVNGACWTEIASTRPLGDHRKLSRGARLDSRGRLSLPESQMAGQQLANFLVVVCRFASWCRYLGATCVDREFSPLLMRVAGADVCCPTVAVR